MESRYGSVLSTPCGKTCFIGATLYKVKILEGLLSETAFGSPLEKAWWKIIDKLHADIYNGRETKSFKEV